VHLAAAITAAWCCVPAAANAAPKIALIIDDLGYRWAEGLRAAHLPGPVAVAILPHAAHSATLAREANGRGKEIVLHVPMQAMEPGDNPGPGALELDQTRAEFATVFAADFAAVPFVRAVSNHMGSLLTRHPGHMRWLMEELRLREPVFFIDSYTTAASVGLQIARENGVLALRRDVFLDDDQAPAAVEAQWQRLVARARVRGFAIGIGHPYPETLALLERVLPNLSVDGIELVPLSALLEPAALL
jgi:polysaccharide deacetylase 2 family uncharacterized protein YibQ